MQIVTATQADIALGETFRLLVCLGALYCSYIALRAPRRVRFHHLYRSIASNSLKREYNWLLFFSLVMTFGFALLWHRGPLALGGSIFLYAAATGCVSYQQGQRGFIARASTRTLRDYFFQTQVNSIISSFTMLDWWWRLLFPFVLTLAVYYGFF